MSYAFVYWLQYINMQARKLSLLVKKSIATPNWLKVACKVQEFEEIAYLLASYAALLF